MNDEYDIGRHLAQRLVADGEAVIDVPTKLSARVRVFANGQGRKTDPLNAHSVAVVALRTKDLRHVQVDDATVALRLLVDHRDELGHARTLVVNRSHRLLLELPSRWGKEVPLRHDHQANPSAVAYSNNRIRS
ncbi:transposase [Amycolatopsis sp. BJA-103]|uniref:IS110 family transposase n=1 Tax=Amycolatopsis sp. BJA-103 TaxID=1911175 RepID=UPI0018EB4E52|nr:transposase [Amycolatopsis sp. BJA-103]